MGEASCWCGAMLRTHETTFANDQVLPLRRTSWADSNLHARPVHPITVVVRRMRFNCLRHLQDRAFAAVAVQIPGSIHRASINGDPFGRMVCHGSNKRRFGATGGQW